MRRAALLAACPVVRAATTGDVDASRARVPGAGVGAGTAARGGRKAALGTALHTVLSSAVGSRGRDTQPSSPACMNDRRSSASVDHDSTMMGRRRGA
jgi:hypothetical protein